MSLPNLYYSIGPVGGFIGEARRTRDWWAGSFILSWLTAVAIKAVEDAKGVVLSPAHLDDNPLMQSVRDPTGAPRAEYEATLPNSFRARIAHNDIPKIRKAIYDNWKRLADAVWQQFFSCSTFASGLEAEIGDGWSFSEVKARWDEQIGTVDSGFWETIWIHGEPKAPSDLDDWMAVEKRHRPPFFRGDVGPGERCMMMPAFRDISGFRRVGGRRKQQQFWTAIREEISRIEFDGKKKKTTLNLGPTERLSAPALVKRLFPLLDHTLLEAVFGWVPDSNARWQARLENVYLAGIYGDQRSNARAWHSTTAVAAYHWIATVVKRCTAESKKELAETAHDVSHVLASAERQSRLWEADLWTDVDRRDGVGSEDVKIAAMDGRMFFRDYVRSEKFRKEAERPDKIGDYLDTLEEIYKELKEHYGQNIPPSNYYAVLHMDGDKMGTLLSSMEGNTENGAASGRTRKDLEDAIANFTKRVRKDPNATGTFDHFDLKGEWLYATADELRALLPTDDAVAVAARIRAEFEEAFRAFPEATISGAIILAQSDLALSWVMRESDDLLERVKREHNGDGLGIAILDFGKKRDEVIFAWDYCPVPEQRLVDFLMQYPARAREAKQIWTGNRVLHDIEHALIEGRSEDLPSAPNEDCRLEDFVRGHDGLVNTVCATALQALELDDGARDLVVQDAPFIAGLLAPEIQREETEERFKRAQRVAGTPKKQTDPKSDRVRLDGLKILRLLVRERRKLHP